MSTRIPHHVARGLAVAVVSLAVVLGWAVSPPQAAADDGDPTSVDVRTNGLNLDVSWKAASAPDVTGYQITTTPSTETVIVPGGARTTSLTGVRPNVAYGVSVAVLRDGSAGTEVAADTNTTIAAPGGSFAGVQPTRVLDTRLGLGSPVGKTQSVTLELAESALLPSSGVSAVVLNVTVTGPDRSGYVTAYPAGTAQPKSSNVNFTARQTRANLVTVPVSSDGRVTLFSSAPTHLVADLSGYYTDAATASPVSGLYNAVQPLRVMDTRSGLGASTPGPGELVKVKVTGAGGVPAGNVSAVVLNTTVAGPSTSGYVTAFPSDTERPLASTLNFVSGQVVANRTIVPVSLDGEVTFYNDAGRTPLVVDVTGWFTAGDDESATGSYFRTVAPTRLVDTRIGLGAARAPVEPRSVLAADLAGRAGLPGVDTDTPPTAVVATVTVVAPTASTYVTAYPSLTARPTASDLNAVVGETSPNLALPGLGPDGRVAVYNYAGRSQVVIDLSGYFIGSVHVPRSTVVVDGGDVAGVSGNLTDQAKIVLDRGATAVSPGQVVAAGASTALPNGLLVRVVSESSDADGRQVLATEPATLHDAIGSGDLAVSIPLSGDDVVESRGPSARRALSATRRLDERELAARQAAPSRVTPVQGTKTRSSCSAGAGSYVDTEFSIEPTLNFEARLGWSGWHPTISARSYAQIKQTASAGFGYDAKASCTIERLLAAYTFPTITFTVGPVPVVIVPQLGITARAGMSGAARVSSSVTQQIVARAGLSTDGNEVKPIKELTDTLTFVPLQLTQANATATVSLTAELIGKFYGVAGPTVTMTAALIGTVAPTKTPWWSLIFDLRARAGLKLDVFILKATVQTDDLVLVHKVLAQAGGVPTATQPVRLTFDEFAAYTSITTNYRPAGIDFGLSTTPYVRSDSSNPTSPVLTGGGPFGDPLDAAFVNPDGSPRTVSTFSVDVGYINQPGSTEVLAYGLQGQLLATVRANDYGIVPITISKAGIHRFLVRSVGVEDSGWAIDNLTFAGFDGALDADSPARALVRGDVRGPAGSR